jgi:hypothetical protein
MGRPTSLRTSSLAMLVLLGTVLSLPAPAAASDCCTAHAYPGCSDFMIELCVCGFDAYCCLSEWDNICAEEVESTGCGSCSGGNGGSGDCCAENGTPGCNNGAITSCVCDWDPFCCETLWDSI